VGPNADAPPLNRLGTADWDLAKRRARRAVESIAQDLLMLYAKRETLPGHAFAPDSEWQRELEASFPYIETEDQLVAIEAVKQDMEKPRPMDRLICGDVGYGKTEVALRAAFKAIMDGKQVAVLVPTTVLAQQHYKTFSQRLKTFPVEVHMLSRFRTRKEQRETIEGLKQGTVDIVIGTHRLLSKDVEFKNLGLLIIDEEQRFGVKHKERIKQLRTQIDVLTLTATPIPRTLYMSLTGVRDLSTIDTPPLERQPIQTVVSFYDETLVRNAILRELDRGGQVFFVHNRVRGIEQVANKLRKLVPEARIAVGHGQMPERELERVMLAFAEGEFDVLVSTTIIESGLDIPNANTIIINQADKFGLAQLYQLRGRVGRSAVRAYAYLLYDKHAPLSPEARRRLEAIQEASELGAGFRIAMRDLEIRGAGELLGAKQHGHIAAVGFDMYVRLLAQAIEELREQGHMPEAVDAIQGLLAPLAPSIQLDLPLRAGIPRDYIENEELRLQLYRRIAGLGSLGELDDMAEELADRFGPLPDAVQDLLFQVKVKLLASRAGVTAIGRDADQLIVRSPAVARLPRLALQHHLGDQARVGTQAIWVALDDAGAWREKLLHVLDILSAGMT
jgi:transcription-repair coupling factor (superfamily II helicase)